MKSKKEIELWDINNMYEYGVQIYHIEKYLKDDAAYKDSTLRKIKRTLKGHHFPLVKEDENSGHEKYQVSADIAKYIVQPDAEPKVIYVNSMLFSKKGSNHK